MNVCIEYNATRCRNVIREHYKNKRLSKNLYKKKLRVYFVKFIRSDKKFKNSSRLIKQMNKDVILAKKGLKGKLVI